MVRKTKAEAELTRQQIIDAARTVFVERGVSRTSLEHIAKQSGVSRGAIYWHFANKVDLFFAMKEQVSLPLVDEVDGFLLKEDLNDSLEGIERSLLTIIRLLEENEVARQTFEIMFFKCEYVEEFTVLLSHWTEVCNDFVRKFTLAYERAKSKGQLREGLIPSELARDTHLFISGLIRLWLADEKGVLVRARAREMIESHVSLRRK